MASIPTNLLPLLLPLLLLFPPPSISDQISPEISISPSPSPAPFSGGPISATFPPSPSSSSPDPSPDLIQAGPASSPLDLIEGDDESELQSGVAESEKSSRGINGGKKVGVVVAAVGGVVVVGFAGLVYKKRRENIRRARYGYATRRDLL